MFLITNIKYIIHDLKLKQDEFGANIDLKRGVIGNYVRGKSQPTIETVIKMAQYCNVSVDELLLTDFQKTKPFINVDGRIEKLMEFKPNFGNSNKVSEDSEKYKDYNDRFDDIDSTLTLIKKTLAQTVIDVENLSLKSKKTKS